MADPNGGSKPDQRPRRENCWRLPSGFDEFLGPAPGSGTAANVPVDPAPGRDEAPDNAKFEESSSKTAEPQHRVSKPPEFRLSSAKQQEEWKWERQSARSHRTRRPGISVEILMGRIMNWSVQQVAPFLIRLTNLEQEKSTLIAEVHSIEEEVAMYQSILDAVECKELVQTAIAKSEGRLLEKNLGLDELENELSSLNVQISAIESEKSERLLELTQKLEEEDDDRRSVHINDEAENVSPLVQSFESSNPQFDVQSTPLQTVHLPPHQSDKPRDVFPGPLGVQIPSRCQLEDEEKAQVPAEIEPKQLQEVDSSMKPLIDAADQINAEADDIVDKLKKTAPNAAVNAVEEIQERSEMARNVKIAKGLKSKSNHAALGCKVQLLSRIASPNLDSREKSKVSHWTWEPSVGVASIMPPLISLKSVPLEIPGRIGALETAPPGTPESSLLKTQQELRQPDVNDKPEEILRKKPSDRLSPRSMLPSEANLPASKKSEPVKWKMNRPGKIKMWVEMAKSRVSPTKHFAMPRVEFQAAVPEPRLARRVIGFAEPTYLKKSPWSDSQTANYLLKSEGRNLIPFVGHGVGQIHKRSKVSVWKRIPIQRNAWAGAFRHKDDWPKEKLEILKELKQTLQLEQKKELAFIPMQESFGGEPKKQSQLSPGESNRAEKVFWTKFRGEDSALMDVEVFVNKSLLSETLPFHDPEEISRMEGTFQQTSEQPYEHKNPGQYLQDHLKPPKMGPRPIRRIQSHAKWTKESMKIQSGEMEIRKDRSRFGQDWRIGRRVRLKKQRMVTAKKFEQVTRLQCPVQQNISSILKILFQNRGGVSLEMKQRRRRTKVDNEENVQVEMKA